MKPIHRFIFEIDGKVYSFQDVTIWDESSYYWFSENNTTIDKLYIDLIVHKYFKSDRTIVCELQKKLYILTGMSR